MKHENPRYFFWGEANRADLPMTLISVAFDVSVAVPS